MVTTRSQTKKTSERQPCLERERRSAPGSRGQQLLDTVRGIVADRNADAAHAYIRHLFPSVIEAEEAAKTSTAELDAMH